MNGNTRLDPWGTSDVKDYSDLFQQFGIEPIEPLTDRLPQTSHYIRRGITFGHRDLGVIADCLEGSKPYAVMSGIKPTGPFHLGSKMTAEEIVYFQSLSDKAVAFYGIADVEAYCDNGLPFSVTAEIAVENVADLLALGLDPERSFVYKQSEEIRVMKLASIFSRGVTHSMMKAIYGPRTFGLYISALYQAGDIMLPQLPSFGGPKPVVVPVGVDQDPHIRLARDLARKYSRDFGFLPPSATYHKLAKSLTGDTKMSKRDPMNLLTLRDDSALVEQKIRNALTGGRETVELQRKLGGIPERCSVYDTYLYHFAYDDKLVRTVYEECRGGERICGDCKNQAIEIAKKFLREHGQKREDKLEEAEQLLEDSRRKMVSDL